MDTVDRNSLIKLDNVKQADEVFDVLHSLGEPIRTTTFIYNPNWCYVGFYNNTDNWTISNGGDNFGSNVISFENFMSTFSSKTPANKTEEDYTGRTIKALCYSPENSGVQKEEKIKILGTINNNKYYRLDINSRGQEMHISKPLDLKEWELLSEESIETSPVVNMKAIQEECKRRFPIGCTYKSTTGATNVLEQDDVTYKIVDDHIYAHTAGGSLYQNGKYATLVSLPEEKTIKQNFIVGKWYKYKGWYIKYKETVRGYFTASEQITDDKKYTKTNGSFGEADYEKVLLEDLSEIQQYLPDGHPDKTQSIPEYVECISKDFSAIHLGTIYKLESRSSSDSYYLKDVNMGSYSSHHFKPSTKEAYDAQFAVKSVKEWKTGTYAVGIKGNFGVYSGSINKISVGKVYTISRGDSISGNNVGIKESSFWIKKENLKWFATKEEAESFASTLTKTEPVYAYVGDPLPTIKTKPLIEDVQSVSVNLRTKKNNNKFKF